MGGAPGLERFVQAQEGIYERAAGELRAGAKRSHWMWFIFPQIAGLGTSAMSRRYALADLAEARAYLAHPLLGPRLHECVQILLDWAGRRDAEEILGPSDAMKLRSSLTLFEAAGGNGPFAPALEGLFGGRRDQATLEIIGSTQT